MTSLTPELERELREVLRQACALVGLDATGAELLRYSVNAAFLLESAPVVVRLRRGATAVVQKTVTVARWFAEENVATVRLFRGCDEMVSVDGYDATFWEAAPRATGRWQGADLAQPLREFHRLRPLPDLPEWDPFGVVRSRLALIDSINVDDRAWLEEASAQLEAAYQRVAPDLTVGLIHGDAHVGNLLRDRSGRTVLGDLDGVARGPVVQDLVPTAVDAARFGRAVRHATLAYAYGVDVTHDQAWPVLRGIRELMVTTGGLANARGRGKVAAQARYRLHTLRTGADRAWWRGYAYV